MSGEAAFCSPGSDGKRVQVVVAHSTAPVPETMMRIRRYVDEVHAIFRVNGRRVRWVTEDWSCEPLVRGFRVPDGFDGDTDDLRDVMDAAGMDSADRKYFVVIAADVPFGRDHVGGMAYGLDSDDSRKDPAEQKSANSPGWAFTRGDNPDAGAHELLHLFGAVKKDAPNADRTGHCDDGQDLMCYDAQVEGSLPTRDVCRPWGSRPLFDCNNDDYWSVDPEPGSYLDSHWNVADSPWLEVMPGLEPMFEDAERQAQPRRR